MIELLAAFAASDDVEAEATFAGKMAAILDGVVRLRGPERERAIALLGTPHDPLVESVVDAAIDAGEIQPLDRCIVIDTLVATIAGLIGVGSVSPPAQAEAVEGFKRLFCGIPWTTQRKRSRPGGRQR